MTNEDLREKIKELFNDHYWDSLSKDRDLILGHCYFIVDEIMSLIQQPEQLYPCNHPGCEVKRTKAEGGTTFTVCDYHWENRDAEPGNPPDIERLEVKLSPSAFFKNKIELWVGLTLITQLEKDLNQNKKP